MALQWSFLNQLGSFSFGNNRVMDREVQIEPKESHIGQQVDVDKLETLICLEAIIVACYQSLAGLVHNQTIRQDCQQFEQQAQYHQEKLRKIFPLSPKSELAIDLKVNHHLLNLKPAYLSLREVIILTINLTTLKTDIYKCFSRTLSEHHEILNTLFEENAEEMYFLRQENNFHQNRLDTFLKV